MAKQVQLYVDQGSDFEFSFTLDPVIDLTEYQVRSSFKKHPESEKSYDFTCTIADAITSEIKIELPAAASSMIPHGKYFYDVEIFTDTKTKRVQEGMVLIRPEITK